MGSLFMKHQSKFVQACILSLAAAVSLGVTRFSYALLLPVMKQDLNWSYTFAGLLNTSNALGYLIGAVSVNWVSRKIDPEKLIATCCFFAAVIMFLIKGVRSQEAFLTLRLLAGVLSAWIFVSGGLQIARLVENHNHQSGLLLGIYYGGTGWGIILSTLVFYWVVTLPSDWGLAWFYLSVFCLIFAVVLGIRVYKLRNEFGTKPKLSAASEKMEIAFLAATLSRGGFVWMLLGYACFGMGYIAYMTFVIAVLQQQGVRPEQQLLFYALLGFSVVISARLWARLLNHSKNGGALAILNFLLGIATIIPVINSSPMAVMASGLLFGSVFLSVVASTTSWVRHNLMQRDWSRGIGTFTVVFAFGQIVGPVLVGWFADFGGGLNPGLIGSGLVLWVGALLALIQKPLKHSFFSAGANL
jgi:predicted MFS family arabinose efflux permease